MNLGLFLGTSATVLISIINIIIREVMIVLINYIGYHTESEGTSAVMTSVFVSSLINTGVILLFTNADMQYSVLSWIPFVPKQYSDFNRGWYVDIGASLVNTMLIMAIFPYVEIIMFVFI